MKKATGRRSIWGDTDGVVGYSMGAILLQLDLEFLYSIFRWGIISMKRIISILAIALAAFVLASCGGGGGGGATVGSNTVGGAAAKGPFQTGSSVTAFKLNANGTRSGTKSTTTVTDNLGSYSIAGLAWGGLTEVEITGLYLDETTGAVSTVPATMSAVINLPAIGGTVSNTTANPNVASTVAASVAKKTLASKPGNVDSVLQSASQTTAAALGLPTKDAAGVPIDLSKLDVTKTADPTLSAANKQLLAVSATLIDAVANGASTSVTALATSLATDVNAGLALGSTSGSTATIQTSQTTVVATAATIAANLTTAVAAAGGTPDPTLAATLGSAARKAKTTSASVLRGLALVGNTFTVGTGAPVTYTVAPSGVATAGGGSIFANAVIFKLTLADDSNTAGTGPKAASYAATLNFKLASTGDTRVISGSLSPVNIVTNGAGAITVTVPATAVLSYNGTTRAGLAVTGTATNVTAITSAANVISINANALATQIGIGITAGTYTFAFGIAGLNIGLEKAIPPGIRKLLPVGTTVGGRAFTGTLTTI